MREIIFRGKDEKTDEWVYGFCTPVSAGHGMKYAIITGTDRNCFVPVFVKRKTIGEYTGLTDKNGVMIFEWDIIQHNRTKYVVALEVQGESGCLIINMGHIAEWGFYVSYHAESVEVIGNIYDNPELLTQGERHGAE